MNPQSIRVRAPRFRRQPEGLPNRQITERSLRLIFYILLYRFIPASLLFALVEGDERTNADHLYHMFHRDIVNRFQIARNTELIYYIDNPAAVRLLASAGYEVEKEVFESVRNNREKHYAEAVQRQDPGQLLFVLHELMISRFHGAVELACRSSQGKVELLWFRQGAVLHHRIQVPKLSLNKQQVLFESDAKQFVPHRPDAVFTLRFPESGDTSTFVYEADRKNTSTKRMAEKFRSHFHFVVKQKAHERRYGVPRIRGVLTETLDSHWADRLCKTAGHPIVSGPKPSPLFWFVSSKLFADPVSVARGTKTRQVPLFIANPGVLFDPIWTTPADGDHHSLVDL